MPIILNLYWMAYKVSILTFMATNSAPNTDVPMVDCFLECQLINDIFIHSMNPVFDLLVFLLQALLSMKIHDPPLSLSVTVHWVGWLPLHPHRNLSNHIPKNNYDLYQDRKSQMPIWSYA